MEENPTRICELLVGLGDVEVLSVDDVPGAPLGVHIRSRAPWPACGGCGRSVWSKGASAVGLVDLPCECRIPGRGWSGPMSVLADESAASCRLRVSRVKKFAQCSVGSVGVFGSSGGCLGTSSRVSTPSVLRHPPRSAS